MNYFRTINLKQYYRYFLVILLISFNNETNAQLPCGTETLDKDIFLHTKNYALNAKHSSKNKPQNFTIKLNINILQHSTFGSPEGKVEAVNYAVDELNQYFSPIGINFTTCDEIAIHKVNQSIIDSSTTEEFVKPLDKFGYINIYVADVIEHPYFGYVCGYANYPEEYSPLEDINCRVMVNSYCFSNKTLIHEFGHLFGLSHTHGYSNKIVTDEWVNGCNCRITGDYICDTPADPNLSNEVFGCKYTGDEVDEFGDKYQPSVKNIMSYSNCVSEFTPEQYQRMLDNFHYYWKSILAVQPFNNKDSIRNIIPNYVLLNDPPIAFNKYQYAVNGVGVEQDHFNPKKAGVGRHTLYFDKPDDVLMSNLITPFSTEKIYPGDTLWQSFKPNYEGDLSGLRLAIFPIRQKDEQGSMNFKISLLEGKGIKGTKIFETILNVPYLNIENQDITHRAPLFKYHFSYWLDVPVSKIKIESSKTYTLNIQSDELYEAAFRRDWSEPYLSALGYETNLNRFRIYEADTTYIKDTTYYWPIDTTIRTSTIIGYKPDLTGLDNNCYSFFPDTTTIIEIDTIYPFTDTIYRAADTIYREADTSNYEKNIGFSTFITSNNNNSCWNNFAKEIQVLADNVNVFPNPVEYYLNISFIKNENLTPLAIEIYSLDGNEMLQRAYTFFFKPVHNTSL